MGVRVRAGVEDEAQVRLNSKVVKVAPDSSDGVVARRRMKQVSVL